MERPTIAEHLVRSVDPLGGVVPRFISVLSLDYDRWAVTASADPTADVVQFAYLASGSGDPTASDWVAGSWEAAALSTGEWVARILIGPSGSVTLTRGTWDVWIKITDSPTAPVWQAGTITVS
jgi:hypothetical protein